MLSSRNPERRRPQRPSDYRLRPSARAADCDVSGCPLEPGYGAWTRRDPPTGDRSRVSGPGPQTPTRSIDAESLSYPEHLLSPGNTPAKKGVKGEIAFGRYVV